LIDKMDSKKKIKDKIKEERRKKEEKEKRLHSLSSEEKAILKDYLDNDTKTRPFSFFSGTHKGLVASGVLYTSSDISMPGRDTFDYNINPWAWDYLRKHPELIDITT